MCKNDVCVIWSPANPDCHVIVFVLFWVFFFWGGGCIAKNKNGVKHGNSEDKNTAHRVIDVSITQMLQKGISDDVTYMLLYAETF